MGISAADAQTAYDAAFAAWQAAISHKSYTINGRAVTRHEIDKLWEMVQKTAAILARVTGTSPQNVRTVVTGLR